jgi:3-oxoacyl-[acyl-carrier protein] reductase
MDLQLRGKKALVCASSRGLGYATAEALAAEGTELCLSARDEKALTEAARRLEQLYHVRVHHVAADLSQSGAPEGLARAAQSLLGQVDILVNNVGGPAPSAAAATGAEAWRKGFEQVFLSSTLLATAVAPGMRERRFGRIVTITSLSVVEPIEHLVVSTAMRLAVTGFAKTLSQEVAADGVTVNTVMPGVIHTQRIEELRQAKATREGSTLDKEMERTAQAIPARRLGRPEELGDLVAFLCSPRAGYITGANIPVDGGLRKSWT